MSANSGPERSSDELSAPAGSLTDLDFEVESLLHNDESGVDDASEVRHALLDEPTPVLETSEPETAVDASVLDSPVLDSPVLDSPVLDSPVLDSPVLDSPALDAGDNGRVDEKAYDSNTAAAVSPELLQSSPSAASLESTADAVERETAPDVDAAMEPPDRLIPFLGFLAALACSVYVFVQMRPDLLFMDTTPSGGDMGAHVWGPAYLRDNLLTQGRITGWTPDWYAGFPAYHFYMVIPSLAIILLNAGLGLAIGIPVGLVILAVAGLAARRFDQWRVPLLMTGVVAAVLAIGVPYGVAFKLVSVSGVVFMPLAGWALGKLAGVREPVPAFLAMGTTVFLFDTNFAIYGGNIASTLAGEFAFSIGLCLALLAMGVAIQGMDRHAAGLRTSRGVAAVVIALVALSHLIPLFFALLGLTLVMLIDQHIPRLWVLAIAITFCLAPIALADDVSALTFVATVGSGVLVAVAVIAADERVRRRFSWLAVTGPVAALLSCFWLAPFYLRSDYFNDMGWERKNEITPLLLTTPMKVALPVAAVGAVLSLATRDRIGMMFSISAGVFAVAVANLGEGKLWNARLSPFYYLSVYLTAAVGIALIARFCAIAVSERFDRPDRRTMIGSVAVGVAITLVALSIPLRALPGGGLNENGVYTWAGIRSYARSFIPSWVAWNYSGYEEKPSFLEYRTVVDTMDELGQSNGCGRAMWEYDSGLDRYGTPMALMLLPHWTDGCIGSMEGLYFESSATTPFHFLNQSTLSENPSRAQRDLPYAGFDINTGIAQLKVMGVRYYMAQTDQAIAAARTRNDLVEMATAEPFVIFEVDDTELVEGLDTEPVVARGPSNFGELGGRFETGWVSQAVAFYGDPEEYQALPAERGPADWERVEVLLPSDGRAIDSPATVSEISSDNSSISFTVDEIGKPVLVKASYFPNWKVDGADGPFRAGPNLMVVVPTDQQVKLHYGYTLIDFLGYALTLLGLVGLGWFAVADHRRRDPKPDEPDAANEAAVAIEPPLTNDDGVGGRPLTTNGDDSREGDESLGVDP